MILSDSFSLLFADLLRKQPLHEPFNQIAFFSARHLKIGVSGRYAQTTCVNTDNISRIATVSCQATRFLALRELSIAIQ